MTLLIGSHVSMRAKNYLIGSSNETIENKANSMMIYTGAPQNTKRTDINNLNIDEMKKINIDNDIENIIVHAPYIVNLGNSIDENKFEFGVSFLIQEIERAEKIGAKCVVLHPGAHVGAGTTSGLDQIVKGLNKVLFETNSCKIRIALETMAGKGTELARSFDELKYIIDNVTNSERLSVCFDTCHVNDAGYDLVNNLEGVINEFDKIIGIEKIDVIHLNDSKNELGSKKDRHENIGYGFIGFDTLINISYHEKFKNIPKILETPFINKTISPYKFEIEMIKSKAFNDFKEFQNEEK